MYEVKVVTYHPFLSVGYMRNMKNIDKMYLPMWDKILVKSFPLESRPLLQRIVGQISKWSLLSSLYQRHEAIVFLFFFFWFFTVIAWWSFEGKMYENEEAS